MEKILYFIISKTKNNIKKLLYQQTNLLKALQTDLIPGFMNLPDKGTEMRGGRTEVSGEF